MSKKANKKKKKKAKKGKVVANIQKVPENITAETDGEDENDKDEFDEDDFDEDTIRIMKILNVTNEDDMEVNDDTLEKYFNYLKDHLDFSELVTGLEHFRWEDYYVFGPGNKKEYEQLKKEHPSYKDKYCIINLEDYDYDESILVNVKRISDGKIFSLPLADLKAVDEDSKNFQLLDDFAVWYCNNR